MITPIKNSLFVIATAVVLGSTIQSVRATERTSQTNTQNDQIGKDWTFIQLVDGISISYATVVIGEERFLSVKFANTTSQALDFIWSMTKNDEMLQITEDEMAEARIQLDAYTAEEYNGTYLIELADEDEYSDFVVSIKPTKY